MGALRGRAAIRAGALRLAAAAALTAGGAAAQVATDGSVGARRSLDGPVAAIGAGLGARRDGNLFHSFRRFSVPAGGRATFGVPEGVDRVIGRVTGREASAIDGIVSFADDATFTRPAAADFWLINPNGVFIGPEAQFRTSGALHLSGGDAVLFADGAGFAADMAAPLRLTSAAPEAFGFLGPSPGPVRVTGAALPAQGDSLTLAGGEVTIDRAALTARAADLVLISAGAGDIAAVDPAPGARASGGRIEIVGDGGPAGTPGSLLTTGGGRIRLIGGDVLLDGGQALAAALDTKGGDVEISARSLILRDGASAGTLTAGAKKAGNISVDAGDILLLRGGAIRSQTLGAGDAGAIRITGFDALRIDRGHQDAETAIESEVSVSAAGDAGRVVIRGGALLLIDGGSVFSSTFGDGDAGAVRVVADRIEATGGGQIASGARDNPDQTIRAQGAGGSVTVIAREAMSFSGQLRARAGAGGAERESSGMLTATEGRRTGPGGDLFARAPLILLTDEAEIGAETFFDAPAGDLRLEGGSLIVSDGAEISTTSRRGGAAGDVLLAFSGRVDLTRDGSIASSARGAGGGAGLIDLSAAQLVIGPGSRLTTDSQATDGGSIAVFTSDFALIDGGVATTSVASSDGDGGSISFGGGALALNDAALIESRAESGDGGEVVIASGVAFIESPDAAIDVSSAFGQAGTIRILGVVGDQTAETEAPPAEFFNRFALIDDFCVAAVTGGSALRLAPREGGGGPALFGGAIPYPVAVDAADLSLALAPGPAACGDR